LTDNPGRPQSFPVQESALAPAVEYFAEPSAPTAPGPQLVTELPKSVEPGGPAYQASLFGPQPVKVAPLAQRPPRRPSNGPRRRSDAGQQQALDFDRLGSRTRTVSISDNVSAAIYGDAEVAMTAQRIVAAGIDIVLPLAASIAFLATVRVVAGELPVTKAALICYAVITVVVALFYRILYCLGSCDTPGIQLAGLRLLNFDGRKPARTERFIRTAGGVLSLMAAGIGLLWATVDEERHTWHDHISKTFPSSRSW